ncbi:MAG TPA: hypothetical protein DEA80_19555 [Afipia sp.]|nr:hypothetical protein [Afipia sp.]
MTIVRSHDSQADINALEATVASARAGFACIFSTSDEYENALITARRAEGRYRSVFDWQPGILGGCALALLGALVTFM